MRQYGPALLKYDTALEAGRCFVTKFLASLSLQNTAHASTCVCLLLPLLLISHHFFHGIGRPIVRPTSLLQIFHRIQRILRFPFQTGGTFCL